MKCICEHASVPFNRQFAYRGLHTFATHPISSIDSTAFEPISQIQIFDRGSAKRWLQKEDDAWKGVERPEDHGKAKHFFIARFLKEKSHRIPVGAESAKYRNERT
jgi:hypothetical protein